MNILKDIPELVKAEVINEETADKIREYYKSKNASTSNKLLVSFSVIGSLLIGLGIILILAHNWDELNTTVKTLLAFVPLIIGQVVCTYVFFKQRDSIAWREASSVFLFITVGSCISLISQIYNIPGSIASFIITWMLLCIPLVYLLRSSLVSLFFIVGITYYHYYCNYVLHDNIKNYEYFILILLVIPHYILLLKENKEQNFIAFHNWFLPLSVGSTILVFTNHNEELIFPALISFFTIFYLIGSLPIFDNKKFITNGLKITSACSSIIYLLMQSFKWFWEDLIKVKFEFKIPSDYSEIIASIILIIIAIGLFIYLIKTHPNYELDIHHFLFVVAIPIFFIGLKTSFSQIFVNLLLLAIGIFYIWKGNKKNHLGILNYGLLVITLLIICRFFDTKITFIIRGLLFVLVGIGFLVSNLFILKKRKTNEA